ncbi:MAG: iron chelate uptake ABC transporter family permease subunit [Deltaproteobacteria bacterium]
MPSLWFLLADAVDPGVWAQIVRFWSLHDPAVRAAVAGVVLLGISSGTLGCFIVLRRLSLLGDSLGHAVLPGVCLGFMVTWTKDPWWIMLGAVLSALLGSWLIGMVQRHSRLKPDVAMGLVLSGFFGAGTVLLTRLQNFQAGNQSGLNQFLFGQATAISEQDLWCMGALSLAIVGCVLATFKELVLTSFDEGFATAAGLPVRSLHYLLMTLTALAVVIAIHAVGVVLVSAMLITPAAAALLFTDRMRNMIVVAVGIATGTGVLGLNLSFLKSELPSGPFVVLTLSLVFAMAYLFSPRYGAAARAWRRWRQVRRTARENGLKSVFLALNGDSPARGISLENLARYRRETPAQTMRFARSLARQGWATVEEDVVRLTEHGRLRARELDRNYRLWELFLTHEVNLPLDHTQRDAENIEHILGPDLVRELEAKYEERHA